MCSVGIVWGGILCGMGWCGVWGVVVWCVSVVWDGILCGLWGEMVWCGVLV